MTDINLFEEASRVKLVFPTTQGNLSVEDLWDLPLKSAMKHGNNLDLDKIAVLLHKQIKEDNVSFVDPTTMAKASQATLRFQIVLHIIEVKKSEAKAMADSKSRKEREQKILGIIADKNDESLRGKSVEELTAMLNAG